MDSIHIQGGMALQGTVRIQGSKNAALPILAATLLTKETSRIYNCPQITDVCRMVSLLRSLGVTVQRREDGMYVTPGEICQEELPEDAVKGMRSSLCLLGSLIGRCGRVQMDYPGGCMIGKRPIDLHLSSLEKMGVHFWEEGETLYGQADRLHGADIELRFPSVGATENIILTAVMAEGNTNIIGAAREPEIVALCDYLECCGASIEGAGTGEIFIHGGKTLYGADYRIPADRIVAGTYLFANVAAGGQVLLEDAPWQQMEAVIHVAEKMGSQCVLTKEGLYVQSPERPVSPGKIQTKCYPGFPTDLQSALLSACVMAEGETVIEEKIFENRFQTVPSLQRMGACIQVQDSSTAIVSGVDKIHGAGLEAKELRGGAALAVAALSAEGESVLTGCSYIYRGYENICRDLRELGVRAVSV